MKSIKWIKLWGDFDEWLCKLEDTEVCKSCGSHEGCFPDWEDQKDKIQELVDAQVREVMKNKT